MNKKEPSLDDVLFVLQQHTPQLDHPQQLTQAVMDSIQRYPRKRDINVNPLRITIMAAAVLMLIVCSATVWWYTFGYPKVKNTEVAYYQEQVLSIRKTEDVATILSVVNRLRYGDKYEQLKRQMYEKD